MGSSNDLTTRPSKLSAPSPCTRVGGRDYSLFSCVYVLLSYFLLDELLVATTLLTCRATLIMLREL